MAAQKITIEGFLDEFKQRHEQMADRPFCWILGSGASIQSGIPSGKDLALQWLSELHKRENFDGVSLEEWATAENLDIPAFEYAHAANFYPWIYQRRFCDYKEQGYAFLEKTMDHAEPSFGYSVLAQIMATTAHKVAVTTNFDNLIADALSIYTRIFPLVCGHESLTGYIRPTLRRPLVAKIHRDLLLAPLSNPDEIAELPIEWSSALKKILDHFTPIVIGYGGNDGSLMGFLETLPPIEGGVFWCYLEGTEIDPKIHEVVQHHHGRLVPTAGFDEVMLQLQETLKLPFLLPVLQSVHNRRVADYQKQFELLTEGLRRPAVDAVVEGARRPARKAAEAAVERLTKEKNWWAWQLKADAESGVMQKEAMLRAGLADFPESYGLMGSLAFLLTKQRKDSDEAEKLFRSALQLNPNDVPILADFAHFMRRIRQDYDESERLYRKALELNPDVAGVVANFALFLENIRKDYDQAETLYRRALELEPNNARTLGNFAAFLERIRQNYDEAEQLYRRALEIDSNDDVNLCNFAQFLGAKKQFRQAHELAVRAWQLLDELPTSNHAEIAFSRWLFDRAAGHDGSNALARLRTLLQGGFPRVTWSFDELLIAISDHLQKDELALARKLANAILDDEKVKELEGDSLWNAIEPISLEIPWPG